MRSWSLRGGAVAGALCAAFVLSGSLSAWAASGSAAKSPEQVKWEQRVARGLRARPAFSFVEEDPALPRVLLIGDSISIGYTPAVRELFAGKANVLRIPENGGPTTKGLEKLKAWLGAGKWDVIHFNWGLHDLKRLIDGKKDVRGEWQVSPEDYERNLDKLVGRLKATGAKLIWAATTPVPEGAAGRIQGEALEANAIAAKVMKKYGVPINDLYAHVAPHLAEYQRPKDVHFTPEGSAFLAKHVAAAILEALGDNDQGRQQEAP